MTGRAEPGTSGFHVKGPFTDDSMNEKLQVYMNTLREDPAEYKVLMPGRMPCLERALMYGRGGRGNERPAAWNIMSDTALLLSAERIADRYACRGKFPRILICDDIMFHGRGIARLMAGFRRIVLERLEEKGEAGGRRLEEDLYRAVGIRVFARSAGGELLLDENEYRILPSQILPADRLGELSMRISRYIRDCGETCPGTERRTGGFSKGGSGCHRNCC